MAPTTLESYASDTEKLLLSINFQPKFPSSQPDSKEEDVEKGVTSLDDTTPIQSEKPTIPPLDWDDEHDSDNPFNWPMWKRVYNTMIPGLLGLAVTFGSSVYTPGYPQVAREFGVSPTAALLPLSLWTLGLGFGPMLGAPASEMFGRKVVYMFSTPISLLFTMGAGLSPTFAGLVVCRLLGGVFGSPVLAVSAGTIQDVWPAKYRARGFASLVSAPFLGPALGPFVGGFSVMNKGWRWTNWDELILLGTFWIGSLFLQETYKKIILRKRAQRRGQELPPSPPASPAFLVKVLIVRPVQMIFLEPIVFFFSLYIAFAFAVLFAFFAAFPIVFEGTYHFNTGVAGLPFLGIGIGVLLAAAMAIIIDKKIYWKKLAEHTAAETLPVPPEERLYASMIGSFGLPIGLFWFAWTARSDVHWISPVLAGVAFGWGNFSIFCSCSLYLGDTYGPLLGASAMAANGLFRYTLGAAFPLFTLPMYHSLGIAWATSIFGFISLLMLAVPWSLYKWGPKLREMSRYKIT